jgi:PHD/YefM family antitoxin component YafN of YafNO toxin-antitoxin module
MNIATKPLKPWEPAASTPSGEVTSTKVHARIKKATGPIVLTRNGRATAVAVDLKSYRQMMAHIERLETVAAIARGLEDVRQGRTRPWEEVRADLERKFSLSNRNKRRRRR